MAIRETDLPSSSALNALREPGDFLDCFFGPHGPTQVTTMEAAHIAMSQMPKWATTLMAARNAIVGPLGLKTGSSAPPPPPPAQTGVGDSIGIFKIMSASDTEVVVGEDDRHLNFRASILKDEAGFYLATWVKPHNLAGHAYLATIMVFHKLIVRDAVRRIVTPHPAT
jgi:hypothetical protein